MIVLLLLACQTPDPAPPPAPVVEVVAPAPVAPPPEVVTAFQDLAPMLQGTEERLPWSDPAGGRVTRYRYAPPQGFAFVAPDGEDYPAFDVALVTFADAAAAGAFVAGLERSADENTGLTYAWDRVVVSGARVVWLHAPCGYSGPRWERLHGRMDAVFGATGPTLACRCGGGCVGSGGG